MEKINVLELLKDCPKGMELDCYLFNGLEFDHLDKNNGAYPIICRVKTEFGGYNIHTFTEYGCYSMAVYSKCVIFPKGKTTWEEFVPPSKFKDGDIIFTYTDKYGLISIFKQCIGNSYCTYIDLYINDNVLFTDTHRLYDIENVITQRRATEEEKEKLFQAIKENGYKWDTETKTLEKLIKPEFKMWDKIRLKNDKTIIETINYIYPDSYGLCSNHLLFFKEQDEWELVPDKFDITTLKPFDKVLTRVTTGDVWGTDFFGYYKNGLFHCNGRTAFRYCIPYQGNEHLLGTTNDCDEYFKIWE